MGKKEKIEVEIRKKEEDFEEILKDNNFIDNNSEMKNIEKHELEKIFPKKFNSILFIIK